MVACLDAYRNRSLAHYSIAVKIDTCRNSAVLPHHLKVLRKDGGERRGTRVYYRPVRETIMELSTLLAAPGSAGSRRAGRDAGLIAAHSPIAVTAPDA